MYPRSGFRSGGTSAKTTLLENHPFLVDVSDIFFFFLLGRGEGRVRGAGRGGGFGFLIENPRKGGGSFRGAGGGGVEGPGGCLRGIGGGALNIFFCGAEIPAKLLSTPDK